MKKALLLLVAAGIVLTLPPDISLGSGRWVVCIKLEAIRGPYGVSQTCYRCALADSGGPGYVQPANPTNPCQSSPGAQWRTFRTRTEAVWWIERNCGCRSSTTLPDPEK
jgi:hypothetical protein